MTVKLNLVCFCVSYIFVEANYHKVCIIKLKDFLKTNNTIWLVALLPVCDVYIQVAGFFCPQRLRDFFGQRGCVIF